MESEQVNSILSLVIGAFAGSLRSVMGWLQSGEPFKIRAFAETVLRTSLIGAAIGYTFSPDLAMTFFQVYFSDAILHKSYKIGKKTLK